MSLYIFRLAIIRLVLLFLYLVQSFFESCFEILMRGIFMTHALDNIFMWLCERDSLWYIVIPYTAYGEIFVYSNGIWMLLFVVTGPQFSGGFKKT
jgi:hypothetical protein